MEYVLWILLLISVTTNISTYVAFLRMKKSRDSWYESASGFAGKLNQQYNKAEARLEQMREDLLDENRF